jgi:Binding-protein-dependent transport system inner membrane component
MAERGGRRADKVLDNLTEDYVRTARAKGASERRVLIRHVLRNSLITIATLLGLSLPAILGGALITEAVFNYPGMGYLFYQAPARRAVHGMMLGGWQRPRSLPVLELRPRASGYAVVAASDIPDRGVKPCSHHRWLEIAPPGDARRVTVSAWLPNDDAYLPACMAVNRKPGVQVSAVVPRSALPP